MVFLVAVRLKDDVKYQLFQIRIFKFTTFHILKYHFMKKPIKILLWIAGIIGLLALLFVFVLGPIMKTQTKKNSPEQTFSFTQGDLKIDVFYCSPAKKDRKIFGELVPYNEVWRTGANEASTFTTNSDIYIDGQLLPAGKYSLWTIPNEKNWKVIFNSKMYGWGVNITDQKAAHEPEYDALIVDAVVSNSMNITENFTMKIVEVSSTTSVLMLSWDDVVVPVKIQVK